MTDRELLEFAAKAAGVNYEHRYQTPDGVEFAGLLLDHGYANYPPVFWNPLTDDGDALRLAVKLRLVIHVWDEGDNVSAAKTLPDGDDPDDASDDWQVANEFACGSLESAARRCIVRAAAEIGKAMP